MSYDAVAVAREVRLIREYLDWVGSPDGVGRSEDKGYGRGSVLVDCIAMILHAPKEHGIAGLTGKDLLGRAALRYAMECGTDSPEFQSLQPAILELCPYLK